MKVVLGRGNSRLRTVQTDLNILRVSAIKDVTRLRIADNLARGRRLAPGERQVMHRWWRDAYRSRNRNLARALYHGWRHDWWRGRIHTWGLGLISTLGGGGVFLSPGDPVVAAGNLIAPDGNPFPCPPGIDPAGGAACFFESPSDLRGPALVTSLEPEPDDLGWQPEEDGLPVPDEGDEVVEPINAVWQTTRFVRLSNAHTTRVTVEVTFETVDETDQVVESTCQVVLGPGEVVDLYQDDWRVNAQRVEVLARADDGREWKRFRKQGLDLVPERDEEGAPGYAAAVIQTTVIAFR